MVSEGFTVKSWVGRSGGLRPTDRASDRAFPSKIDPHRPHVAKFCAPHPEYTQCGCVSRCRAQCSPGVLHLHLDTAGLSCIEDAAALRWWSFCSIFLHCLHSVPFGASKLTHRRVIFEQICLGCACQSYYYLNFSFGMDGGHFRMCFCCLFVLSSLIWTRSTTDGAM